MLKILSRSKLRELVNSSPNIHNCIVISEPGQPDEVADILPLCKDYLNLEFWDISFPYENGPTEAIVKKALDWSKDFDDIVVACRAGVSRSAAIAYLVNCTRKAPEKAIKILDARIHNPNLLVIKLGAQILGEEIMPPIEKFYLNSD